MLWQHHSRLKDILFQQETKGSGCIGSERIGLTSSWLPQGLSLEYNGADLLHAPKLPKVTPPTHRGYIYMGDKSKSGIYNYIHLYNVASNIC